MEGSVETRAWLRCYRCWSTDLEVQVHYEGIHKIDPETGERSEVVDEMQEAVVQCLDCMHDQPHLGFRDGRVEPIEDRWERMIAGTPWVASCTVTVEADDVETCAGLVACGGKASPTPHADTRAVRVTCEDSFSPTAGMRSAIVALKYADIGPLTLVGFRQLAAQRPFRARSLKVLVIATPGATVKV